LKLKLRTLGFSLLEILVALAIITLIATVLTRGIQFDSSERVLQQQAVRLVSVINWMCESAEADGRVLGLSMAQSSYAVVMPPSNSEAPRRASADTPADGEWQIPPNREMFANFELPEGLTLALRLNDDPGAIALLEKRPPRPQLVCAGNSELPNFEISVGIASKAHGADALDKLVRIINQPPSLETPNVSSAMLAPVERN
jgi:type II secretion system protein H